MFHLWSQIPSLYPIWVPIFVLPRVLVYYYLSAGGCEGCIVEIKIPPNSTCAESDIAVINRFNFIWACLMRRHHWCIGTIFPTPYSPVMKLLFHVLMACSVAFFLCMWRGNNWNDNDCCLSNVFSASEDLLSDQCVSGLNPLLASSYWTFLYARRIEFLVILLKGSVIFFWCHNDTIQTHILCLC